ncbi:hypothetical protein JNUCC83_08415 [Vagococcus sp. JNUCC 83]
MISSEWLLKDLEQAECRIKSFIGYDASYYENGSPIFRYRTDYTVLVNDADIQEEIIVTVYKDVSRQCKTYKCFEEIGGVIMNLYVYNYIEDGLLKTRGHASAVKIKKETA